MKTEISDFVAIQIPVDLFVKVADFLREKDDHRSPVTVIWGAIDYWLDNADWKPELLRTGVGIGYQWKSLFLPDGTQARMQYKGAYFYAKVDGDKFIYQGESLSPGSFANQVASSSRNAWRDLWIKRPADAEWRLADDLRHEDEV